MIRYFASHQTAANILMFVILIGGFLVLPSLNKETFPEFDTNKVQITIVYPGASPIEVEEGLCNRLEDATDGISFLEEQHCAARDNVGIMTLDMLEAGNIQQFLDDVKSAVDEISDFPDNTEQAIVEELGRTKPIVSVAINTDLTQSELKSLVEYYRDQLLAIPEIPIVKVTGFSTHQFNVLIKPESLLQYQLSIEDIAQKIRLQSIDMPAGNLESHDRTYQIRFLNERRSVNQLRDLIILDNVDGAQLRLGEIATVVDDFTNKEVRSELNGKAAAILNISKNVTDDTLTVFHAVKNFVDEENARLPQSTRLVITQDGASIVQERLNLLLTNGWQGLLLASLALLLFFNWRYTFWVALGLPISFVGGLVMMSVLGVSINMISMVALLMSIGILMDDAIVISESIENEYRKGKSPLQASIDGIKRVARGVMSSFTTSAILFGSLLFLQGDMGQIMAVLPVVLLSVLSISLVEAFMILPHHLKHSLELHHDEVKANWRIRFEASFERLKDRVGQLADLSIRYRYLVLGSAIALFAISVSMIPAGYIKFKAFPDLEGNMLDVRVIMPQGTPISRTEKVVSVLLESLDKAVADLPHEKDAKLIKNIQVSYSHNLDAGEEGAHLATISLDLLDAEIRTNSLNELRRSWTDFTPVIADAISIQYKEPISGPAGQAISIRLQGEDLNQLSKASWELQNWLKDYPGVSNILDDLRPGKPQFSVKLYPGALDLGLDSQQVSSQLRAAYQGIKVSDVYQGREAYEINVQLDSELKNALADFVNFSVFTKQGKAIPLVAIAEIKEVRQFSRIVRVNHKRTITISGDVDSEFANTNEVMNDTKARFLPKLKEKYPGLSFALEGEVKNSAETNNSVLSGFVAGIAGVYLLLSLTFRNYREPLIVLINIPLALIGVIWGHMLMGLDLTLPSIIGFVSLAGIVVNDSILLVEYVKVRSKEGMSLHQAAGQAVRDRFRAIFLTSITTIAGMSPLLMETSLQAQILVPMVASVVFGMLAATVLTLMVLPASYTIMEDFGFAEVAED